MYLIGEPNEDTIQHMLEALNPLNEYELIFRRYYQLTHQVEEFSPEEAEEIRRSYDNISRKVFHMDEKRPYDVLSEEISTFFPNGPIQILKHMRYIPQHFHVHTFLEMFYVVRGKGTHICGDRRYQLQEGDFCLWQADLPHAIHSNSDEFLALNIMIQKPTFQRSFGDLLNEQSVLGSYFTNVLYGHGDSPMLLFRTGEDRRLKTMMAVLLEEYQKQKDHWEVVLCSYLNLLLTYLIREHAEDLITSDEQSTKDPMLRLIQYIESHYADSLEATAEEFGYTPSYLSRMIKRKTGKNYSEIVKQARMSRGAALLRETQKSIAQIAREVHCADASHFARMFQKVYGVSPSVYREQCLAEV